MVKHVVNPLISNVFKKSVPPELSVLSRGSEVRTNLPRKALVGVPKCPAKIFCVISGDFKGFRVQKRCFRVLLLTLFPRSPSL